MKVWMLWHGGVGYAVGQLDEDVETFDSLAEAKRAFDVRADSWNTYYPCVERDEAGDGGPSAWIFFYDPRDERDPYPDRILSFGPRGGVRVERA